MTRPRSVIEFIRDTQVSHAAQRNYRQQAAWLRALAHTQLAGGDEKTARQTRYFAFMAENAARSEYFDEQPAGLS